MEVFGGGLGRGRGRGRLRFLKVQRMNFYIVGQVIFLARITGDGRGNDSRRWFWRGRVPEIRLSRCRLLLYGLFFCLCRFVGESVQFLLVKGAQGGGNRFPAFIERCKNGFIFPQNLHFHAVYGSPVICCIAGFQLHGFHRTGKPLGKVLGNSRIPRAASEQSCYILLCRCIQ